MMRARGIKASLMVMVLIVSGTMFAFSSSAGNGPRSDSWTVALYVAADNNLEVAWDQYSMKALLDIPATKDVNFVAMVDRLSTEGLELLEFSGDTYEVAATYPEMNTGDGATFTFFLDEIEAKYPAKNMCIIPWDHGGSWRGLCSDESQGGLITMEELSTSLIDAALPIDVMVLDACIMSATEVVYEASITGMVTYLVASEMYVPYDGFPYDDMFTPLASDSSATPEELLGMIFQGWDDYYHNGRCLNLVASDVAAFGQTLPAFQAWSEALLAGLETYRAEYETALADAFSSDYIGTMVDACDLCEQLIANVPDQDIIDTSTAVISAIESSIVSLHTSRWAADMHGMSIWWASVEYLRFLDPYINEVQFVTDSGWGELQTAWVL